MKRFFCLIGKNGLITTKCKISWINCTNEKKYVAVRAALETLAVGGGTISRYEQAERAKHLALLSSVSYTSGKHKIFH